jgi:hypothetical protein
VNKLTILISILHKWHNYVQKCSYPLFIQNKVNCQSNNIFAIILHFCIRSMIAALSKKCSNTLCRIRILSYTIFHTKYSFVIFIRTRHKRDGFVFMNTFVISIEKKKMYLFVYFAIWWHG